MNIKTENLVIASKGPSTSENKLWNPTNKEHQELAKFDLLTAQFKAMKIEVNEGRRTQEDLEPLKVELSKM